MDRGDPRFWIGVLSFGLMGFVFFIVAPAIHIGKLYQKSRELRVPMSTFFFEALSGLLFYWLIGFFLFSVFRALGYDVSSYVRFFFSPSSGSSPVEIPHEF